MKKKKKKSQDEGDIEITCNLKNGPTCRDIQLAITQVREKLFTINASCSTDNCINIVPDEMYIITMSP